MGQYDGELAALRHQREMDALNRPPGIDTVLDATASIAEMVGLSSFAGLFRKALKNGQTPVEKIVDQVEAAAFAETQRIWERFGDDDIRWRDFETRMQSQEAEAARLSAILHGLRSSDPKKHKRLGALTISCIFADELEPENLDGLMRAAVELTESDIGLLDRLYKSQKHILKNNAARPFSHQWYEQVGAAWEQEFSRSEGDHLNLRGSLMRLRSLGMIAETGASLNGEFVKQHFGLLWEGKKFYERLQEIDATKYEAR